ncbi:hypothetical protein KQI88_04645 [Alkaliphilus sp. MSJ-5]|uniref:DUF4037 domain-containing protein n=1 Tax=Alkaliphilus flagellatus TaxID=2841507 RepID=A0ABS6FZM0_9FIRM|nr:hypothetical protein [Alkaliphilus flagellatus]MBU5675698.1 hypothetical protein [Alkaliphilus flagellatus]
MKPTQKELTDWAITQIQEKYKDDIALLIGISGHSLENDCHGECFDYFVPTNENGNKLAQTFIIDGVGHDLYPRSWKRIENMAEFNDDFTNGLADAKILYSRNEEDKKRFVKFQEKLMTNLEDKDFMFKKALGKLDTAMEIYRTMIFEDSLCKVKMGAGFIARYLSVAVACINGTYFKQRLDLETVELSQMKEIPDNFVTYFEEIVKAKSVEELKKLCYEIISTARKFIAAHKPSKAEELKTPIYKDLAAWYEEMSLTWRRIYYHCDNRDYQRTFPDALNLQHELNIIKEEFGLREMDLLGNFDATNLSELKQRAQELEGYIVSEIESHGVAINKYDTLEQFLAKNS